MRKWKEPKEPAESLRMDYIMSAAFYWLRAEGPDENMVSALNRMKARGTKERLEMLNIALPTAKEIYSYAAERWPKHKLHSAPSD